VGRERAHTLTPVHVHTHITHTSHTHHTHPSHTHSRAHTLAPPATKKKSSRASTAPKAKKRSTKQPNREVWVSVMAGAMPAGLTGGPLECYGG
jgi:hypothetical protein